MRRSAWIILGSMGLAACSGAPASDGPEVEHTGETKQAIGSCAGISASNLEFQDDGCKKKRQPSNKDRFVGCPIASTVSTGFVTGTAPHTVDKTALKGVVPDDINVVAIIVRRVAGVPYYRYLSNGTEDEAYQPWSSTKFMAVAGAGAALRKKSGGKVGLTAKAANGALLGDLVTIIASYRQDRYTSNGLARYFLNVAGRPAESSLIHDWLGRPASETYGGNYGAPTPGDLGYTFTEANGDKVTITPDETAGPANHLSAHTEAEFMKRLVAYDDAQTRLPDLQKADIETMLYGPPTSAYYPGQSGGLQSDNSVYVQGALDMDKVEKDSQGKWRTFGKVGYSGDGEFVFVSHTCLPVLDAAGNPVPNKGAELVITTRAIQSGGKGMAERDQDLGKAYKDLFAKVLPLAQTEGPPLPDGGASSGGSSSGASGTAPPGDDPPGGTSSGESHATPRDDGSDDSSGCAVGRLPAAASSSSQAALGLVVAALATSLAAARRRQKKGH